MGPRFTLLTFRGCGAYLSSYDVSDDVGDEGSELGSSVYVSICTCCA